MRMGTFASVRTSLAALAILAALASSCKTTSGGSHALDDQWSANKAAGATQYATIEQDGTTGNYFAYFTTSATAVNVCFADDATCRANPSLATRMTLSNLPGGGQAYVSASALPLKDGSFLTFYARAQNNVGIQYKIATSANGQLDTVALSADAGQSGQTAGGAAGGGTADAGTAGGGAAGAADPLVPNPKKVPINKVEASIIHESNLARQQNGLSVLPVDAYLMSVARSTAQYNAQNNTPNRHSGANTYENVYYMMPDAHAAVFGSAMGPGWLDHPGHRENLLNSGVRGIGASMAVGADGTPHWVEDFL